MRKFMKIISLLFLFFCLDAQLAQAADSIGSIKKLNDAATFVREKTELKVKLGDRVFMKDVLKTDNTGSLGITFKDNTMISIGPNTVYTIDEYVFKPGEKNQGFVSKISKGTLYFVSGRLTKLAPEAVKVKTPEATIGFRGTRCLIKVEDNLTTFTGVKVDKGKGDYLYSMPLTTPGFPDDHYSYNSVATSPGVEVDKGKDYVSDYSYSYSSPAEPPVVPSDQDGWPTNSKIVLVPEDDGKVGEISVATFAGAQILNKPWEATELVSPNALPSAPKVMDEAEVKNIFKEALAALPIPSIIHIIYFESGNAALTSGSLQAVQEIIEEIKSQKSNQIMVLGYTDTVGAVEYNRKLSQRRAKSVADVLVSKGVEDAIIEIEYYGKEGLFIKTPDGVNEPRNRRVEIIVR